MVRESVELEVAVKHAHLSRYVETAEGSHAGVKRRVHLVGVAGVHRMAQELTVADVFYRCYHGIERVVMGDIEREVQLVDGIILPDFQTDTIMAV